MTQPDAGGAFATGLGTVGYPPAWRLLHWLTALIVLALVPMGIYMANGPPGPLQDSPITCTARSASPSSQSSWCGCSIA